MDAEEELDAIGVACEILANEWAEEEGCIGLSCRRRGFTLTPLLSGLVISPCRVPPVPEW